MTIHYIDRRPNKTFHDDPGYFEAAQDLRIGNHGYAVGGWDETTTGRLVQEGPKVPGPQVYAFGLAVVIALHPLPAEKPVLQVAMGDHLRIDGHTYEIAPAFNQNIKLVPVTPALICTFCSNPLDSLIDVAGCPENYDQHNAAVWGE